MKRDIVKIDNEKCNGCGACIPNCHEGALQVIDGKAVLISDLMCDGLGACLGYCPEGALEIISCEAEPYDEIMVMKEMISKGKNVVIAHLKHLKDHNEFAFLKQGVSYMTQNQSTIPFDVSSVIDEVHHSPAGGAAKAHATPNTQPTFAAPAPHQHGGGGCPGSQSKSFTIAKPAEKGTFGGASALTQWPVQMHLINPLAAHFQGADLLIAADCVAFSLGNFHQFLEGKKLAIACPKLDSNKEIYTEKIIRLINESKVNTIQVMIMEVPCCGGLLQLVINAAKTANRKVPIKAITVGIQGEILSEDWV